VGNVSVVRPRSEVVTLAMDQVDHWESLTGRKRCGKEDSVSGLAVQSSAEEGDVLHGDSGCEAWMIKHWQHWAIAGWNKQRGKHRDEGQKTDDWRNLHHEHSR
jgi:hypothetical protein